MTLRKHAAHELSAIYIPKTGQRQHFQSCKYFIEKRTSISYFSLGDENLVIEEGKIRQAPMLRYASKLSRVEHKST